MTESTAPTRASATNGATASITSAAARPRSAESVQAVS